MRKSRNILFALAIGLALAAIVSSCSMPFGNQIKLQNDSSQSVTVLMYIGNTNSDGSMLYESFSCASKKYEMIDVDTNTIYVKSWSPSSLNLRTASSEKTIYVTD